MIERTSAKSRLMTGQGDQVGDALDALAEDVVGDLEGVRHRGRLVEHFEQAVVRDDDEGVDLRGEGFDALVGLLGAGCLRRRTAW